MFNPDFSSLPAETEIDAEGFPLIRCVWDDGQITEESYRLPGAPTPVIRLGACIFTRDPEGLYRL